MSLWWSLALVAGLAALGGAEVPLVCVDTYAHCRTPKLQKLICDAHEYKNMALYRCARTCNRCRTNRTRSELDFLLGCKDQSEQCLGKLELCQKAEYFKMMSRMCPLTCNFCGMWSKDKTTRRRLKKKVRASKKVRAAIANSKSPDFHL